MQQHLWNVLPKDARKIQEQLRGSIEQRPLPAAIQYIAGTDVSFNKYEKDIYAGIIILSYPGLVALEYSCIKVEVDFPYIPGFLSFREVPPLLLAWENITLKPDVIIADGHGIAHPRRLGIAAHFGLVVGIPTIGAAKKILYGKYEEPTKEAGSIARITDPANNETIGAAVRTKARCKPMFISPGHLCTVDDAVRITQEATLTYRLPEPTRRAHELVNKFRRGELEETYARIPQTQLF